MSQQGIDFLNEWVRENVNADAYPNNDKQRAEQLVAECLAEAAKHGITRAEIEEDMGNLEDHMMEAMEAATDAEVDRLKGKDD